MAKPRIFISSTYYDLKHIRKNLESFINNMGYESILFESGDVPFHHNLPLDISCYKEIEKAHMQILIIGGRYGSPDSDLEEDELEKIHDDKMYLFYNSITQKEYETAVKKGIPIFVFVENGVWSEYSTYKKNKTNKSIDYAHVDSINVFKLLDGVLAKKTGNFTKGFDNIDDITNWLKLQWAGMFAEYLGNEKSKIEIKDLQSQIRSLGSVTSSLKEYTEAIMKKVQPEDYQIIIDSESKKLIYEKARRLSEEEMIDYLKNKHNLKNSEIELYNLLKKYKTVSGFINNSNMPQKEKEIFLEKNISPATEDYEKFRKSYL
jgi:hypothetical protein